MPTGRELDLRRSMGPLARLFAVSLPMAAGLTSPAGAQLAADYVLVGAADSSTATLQSLSMFDRRLELLNELSGIKGSAVVTDADGSRWVLSDAGGLLHIDAVAQPGGTLAIGPSPRPPAIDSQGRLLVATSASLTAWSADGTSLWSVPLPFGFNPRWVAVDTAGDVHVGGSLPPVSFFGSPSGLMRYSAHDGGLLGSMTYPPDPDGDHWILQVRAGPDGTVWSNDGIRSYEHPTYFPFASLLNTSRDILLSSMPFGPHGEMGEYNTTFCVDGAGRLLVPDYDHVGVGVQTPVVTRVLRYDAAQPASPQGSWDLGDDLRWFELGPTGEELYAVTVTPHTISSTHTWRLVRLNLSSDVKSSIVLATTTWSGGTEVNRWLLRGDPTGFVFANTVDRVSDADADGAANGAETAAGSNPFDPDSRPDGPKVYVSFAPGSNAIEMTLFDPDGLRHPTKGIDFATMSLTIGDSGNLFWALLSLVTEASLSADGKTAHAVFGGLPLANDLKLRVEMTVRDRTGAIGWDWQATPPGDL